MAGTTGEIWAAFPDRVITGTTDLKNHLVNATESALQNAVKRVLPVNGVLATGQTMTYAAGAPDTLSLATAERHYVQDGHLMTTLLAAMEGCTSMGFDHDGATLYYVGLRRNTHPGAVFGGNSWGFRQGKSGANVYAISCEREAIGEKGDPAAVAYTLGNLEFNVSALCKSTWADGGTRDVVIWKKDPVTAGSDAIWTGTVTNSGPALVKAVVPHTFGQGVSPSVVPADYEVMILGATITTVDITADDDYCFLGTFDCATNAFDYSGQTVVNVPGVNGANLTQLMWDLYPVDSPAPTLDGDGVANMGVSLGNLQRLDAHEHDCILGVGGSLFGTPRGLGRTGAGIKLNTNKAGYQAFNTVAGLSEAAGTVTVALGQNAINASECIVTQGAMCTFKTATDWTAYDYIPAGDGFYCVYYTLSSVSYANATTGVTVEITTSVDGAAISPQNAVDRRLANGYLPLYGYEINAGALVVGTKYRAKIEGLTGLGAIDDTACQYEERERTLKIGSSEFKNSATKVVNAPPTVNVELSYPAAADYTLTPISLPAGYEIVSVDVDADANVTGAGAATSTMRARICDTSGALSADVTWADADGRVVRTITPTLATHEIAAPQGLVWVEIEKDSKGAGDGDGRCYDVTVTYARYMA